MGDKAFITPNVLKWASESARMSEATAAAKISVSVDKLKEWEGGQSQPTIKQAQTLAKAYKRPFDYSEFLKRKAEKKAKNKEKDKPGGPNYFLLQLNRNSRLFTQTVLDAFHGGNIEATLASNLLNVQVNKLQKLEAQLYG